MNNSPVITIVGLPGAGKTTLGKKLTNFLAGSIHDSDDFLDEIGRNPERHIKVLKKYLDDKI